MKPVEKVDNEENREWESPRESSNESDSPLDNVDSKGEMRADIETGIDALLSFLENKSKLPVSDIADNLSVPEKSIKVWGKALEEAGYVKIKYSAIKGMTLEYDSEKSYDELNIGRSEFSTGVDGNEIEAENEEEIEESSEYAREAKNEENQRAEDTVEYTEVEQTRNHKETPNELGYSEENVFRKSDSALARTTPIDEPNHEKLDSRLGGHGEKLISFGRALKSPDRDNDAVYDEINSELVGLKNYLRDNGVNDQDRKAIFTVMNVLQEGFNNSTEEYDKSKTFSDITQKIKGFWSKHKPSENVNV